MIRAASIAIVVPVKTAGGASETGVLEKVQEMVPALTTRTIIIFQDTSPAYVADSREFLLRVNLVDTREGGSIELYLFAGPVYPVLCSVGSYAAHRLEQRREVLLA